MSGIWGNAACRHWQRHLPHRLAALDDPDAFFDDLDREAAERDIALRDGLLVGVSPNNGTITWPEFFELTDRADRIARAIVDAELIYVHDEDLDKGTDR